MFASFFLLSLSFFCVHVQPHKIFMEFCHPFDERLERLRATKLQPFICQTDATERILTMKMHEERHIDELSPSELPKLQIMLTFFSSACWRVFCMYTDGDYTLIYLFWRIDRLFADSIQSSTTVKDSLVLYSEKLSLAYNLIPLRSVGIFAIFISWTFWIQRCITKERLEYQP